MLPPSRSNNQSNPLRLSLLEQQVKAHWVEHRPKMCHGLQAKGLLDQSVKEAVERTKDAVISLVLDKGVPLLEAKQLLEPEWMWLPSEDDHSILNESPDIGAAAGSHDDLLTFASSQIDQETYHKALPHLISVARHFQQAGRPLEEFIKDAYDRFGVTIRPYLTQFLLDVKAGYVHLGSASEEVLATSEQSMWQTTQEPTPSVQPRPDEPSPLAAKSHRYGSWGGSCDHPLFLRGAHALG